MLDNCRSAFAGITDSMRYADISNETKYFASSTLQLVFNEFC